MPKDRIELIYESLSYTRKNTNKILLNIFIFSQKNINVNNS